MAEADLMEMAQFVGNFSVAGLLFIMWWYERKDRQTKSDEASVLRELVATSNRTNEVLIEIVRDNAAIQARLVDRMDRWETRPCLFDQRRPEHRDQDG